MIACERIGVPVADSRAMSEQPIGFSPGLPSTVLPPPTPDAGAALAEALTVDDEDERRQRVGDVAARWPRLLDAWAALGDLGRDRMERYAYYRVGYHRGLDALRAAGWRGSGYVRWAEDANRGFLRALQGLRDAAGEIGETDELERCHQFLVQLDPAGPWGTPPTPS